MNRKDRSVREALRAHDPLREGGELSPVDRARMRQRVLEEVREVRVRPALAPLAAGLGACIAAFMAGLLIVRIPAPVSSGHPPGVSGISHSAGESAASMPPRQIQMTTPGGTRIIWVLRSEANL